ncbi:MAG: hypothetical protein U0470_06175 [Anaerolineae bacterium]
MPPAVADVLLAEILGRPAAHAALGRLCDTVGGRPAGGDAARAAEDRAYGLLSDWGLHDVRFDAFDITAWTRGPLVADVVAPTRWALTAFAHGNCSSGGRRHRRGRRRRPRRARRLGPAATRCAAGWRWPTRTRRRACGCGTAPRSYAAAAHGAAALLIHSRDAGSIARTGVCADGEAAIPSPDQPRGRAAAEAPAGERRRADRARGDAQRLHARHHAHRPGRPARRRAARRDRPRRRASGQLGRGPGRGGQRPRRGDRPGDGAPWRCYAGAASGPAARCASRSGRPRRSGCAAPAIMSMRLRPISTRTSR